MNIIGLLKSFMLESNLGVKLVLKLFFFFSVKYFDGIFMIIWMYYILILVVWMVKRCIKWKNEFFKNVIRKF